MRQRNILGRVFPSLIGRMSGTNYPMTPAKKSIVKTIRVYQVAVVVLLFVGAALLSALGLAAPQWFQLLQDNSGPVIVSAVVLHFVCSMMSTSGAFEIFLDGDLVSSKLASGRVTPVESLVEELIRRGVHPRANYKAVLANQSE